MVLQGQISLLPEKHLIIRLPVSIGCACRVSSVPRLQIILSWNTKGKALFGTCTITNGEGVYIETVGTVKLAVFIG